ncbi:MAG: hypothetical protein M1837_000662 [Sclerophora amabilis]|nr:MAG: hypothetical protein M1837_000662 [Sclerophora amabilis]
MSIPLKDLAAVPPRSSRSPAIDKLPTDDPPTSPISPSSTSSSQFTSGPTINLEVCVVDAGGVRPKTLRSCKEAQDYFHDQPKLTTSSNDDGGITDPLSSAAYIICLYQAYRWGPLTISEEVANLVTAHVETFPEFSNLTNKFRKAQGPRDEGWCEFHSSFTPIQSQLPGEVNYVIESCYLLNHVEWNGRPGAVDPWTIHQSGVYQKYLTFEQSACILIEPSINMQNRLRKTLKEGQAQTGAFISHWTELHILSIEDLDDNWQAYVNFLHDSIMEIYRQIRFFRLGGTPGGEGDRLSDVTFEQMRRLQYFSEKLLRAAHILQNNVEVLTALLGQSKTMCALDKAASKSRYEALDTVLDRRIRAQGFCKNYVQSLSKRSDRISVEVQRRIPTQEEHAFGS